MGKAFTAIITTISISQAAGCSLDEPDEFVAVEQNSLDVTHANIHHETSGGDKFLVVTALDASDHEVGRATLRIGKVLYSSEPDIVAPEWTDGSELTLAVGERSISFPSPDRFAHREIVPDTTLLTLAKLSAIEDAMNQELGITFGWPERNETAYTWYQQCNGANFPQSSSNCCYDGYSPGYGGYTIFKRPDNTGLGLRGLYYACTNSNGTTCTTGGTSCWYGPCGGHPYTLASPNNSNAFAYIGQNIATGVWDCYGDSNGGTAGGGYENPCNVGSPCTTNLWAGLSVTATCPYTGCDASGHPY